MTAVPWWLAHIKEMVGDLKGKVIGLLGALVQTKYG